VGGGGGGGERETCLSPTPPQRDMSLSHPHCQNKRVDVHFSHVSLSLSPWQIFLPHIYDIQIYVCIHVSFYVYTYFAVSISICLYIHALQYISIYIQICIYIHKYTYISIHTNVHICTYIYIYIYIYIYKHRYVYIYMHTHTLQDYICK